PCHGAVNLNVVLQRGGFLSLIPGEAAGVRQRSRTSAASTLLGGTIGTYMLQSMEGRLNLSATVAASPIAGCVFINRTDLFADGCVAPEEYEKVFNAVKVYLESVLLPAFGTRVRMAEPVRNPALHQKAMIIPDLIISIEGIEFHNMQ